MKVRDVEMPDTRSLLVKASEFRNTKSDYLPPHTLGKPKEGTENSKRCLAMDSAIANVLSGFKDELMYMAMPKFIGYAMLSNVSQEALIRAGVETIADEMTRSLVEFTYDDDDGNDSKKKEELITAMNTQAAKYRLTEIFNDALVKDGLFGGCLIYIDMGDLDEDEAMEPLIFDRKTFKKGSFRGFKVIEPINIYPGTYNTNDPTSKDYFKPTFWYILGKRYHASRFIYIASNEAPLLLKPAYNFFGIPRAQLALDYVAQFVANRESAQELLNKFSLTCWKTNMAQVLQGASTSDLMKRAKLFNKMKHNSGVMLLDKESEDMVQINTPLAGVRDIVEMSLGLLTAVWRIPKIKYIGEGEGGLNASSKEQMRSFYDFILSQKKKVLTQPMEIVLKIFQLNLGYDVNESLGFMFPAMVEMDEADRASLNKMEADRDNIYLANGVLSQEEVRQRLSLDKNSGYSMIDIDDVPEIAEEPLKKDKEAETNEVERQTAEDMAMDDRWITIKKNHDDEEEKGRHLLLKGEGENQETPSEAMKRQWNVDLNKKEDKKEEKTQKEEKPAQKEEKKDSEKKVEEYSYEESRLEERRLSNEIVRYDARKREFVNNSEEYKELLEKQKIASNRYYQTPMSHEKEREKLWDEKIEIENKMSEKYDELEYEFDKKNADSLREIKEKLEKMKDLRNKKFEELKESAKKEISGLSDEQLINKDIVLQRLKRERQDKIRSEVGTNEEYIKLNQEAAELRKKRDELGWDAPKEIHDRLSEISKRTDDILTENIFKQEGATNELDAQLEAIKEERNERREKKQEAEKERLRKEREEKAARGKEIAKETYYPKTIAGVSRGKEMSEDEADSGNPNPKFNSGEAGYGINCQSCVVCYEARLRGYDVSTMPNKRGSKLSKLAHETADAWIDPKTGLKPEYIRPDTRVKNSSQYYKFLENTVEKGKRYTLGFAWKGRGRTGHIVSLRRDTNNRLEIYDPQSGRKYKDREVFDYLGKISYRTTVRSVIEGMQWGQIKEVSSVELLRVDNLSFNPEYMNDIMERRK